MGVNYTEEQKRVIYTRGRNILVSAAAGSGKTAVLVERIIQKICAKENPVDIDRMLIVTFTSAAAAQMRERISDAIAKKLEEEPDNEHLQKQSALIHNAQITTIDSFCLFLIRNNFNAIDLDPGFRVADEGEMKLTKQDVLDKLLEEQFAQGSEEFLNFVECYSTGVGEKNIEEAITRLYDFAMSYPFANDWLLERKQDYNLDSLEQLEKKQWYQQLLQYKNEVVAECMKKLSLAIELASSPAGPDQYLENLEDDRAILKGLLDLKEYEKLYKYLDVIKFTTLSRKKGTDVDPDIKDLVKNIRDGVKATVKDLQKDYFSMMPETIIPDMQACKCVVNELVDLTLAFKERLDQEKRNKNLIDFSDMEHFALQILMKKNEQGEIELSEIAKELQDYFDEIMIDEYQDSNDVQEKLLQSISGEDKGRFNRFMVGDVKQSIYKFRLARPEIFMEKYDAYDGNEDAAETMRIDLSKNFRSRCEVTESANYICGQIMKKPVGNVEYDEKAALHAAAAYQSVEGHESDYQTEVLIAGPQPEDTEEAFTSKELEAHMVAQKILELKDSFLVTDSKTGEIRPAKFGDIVLLFRATSGWDEDFRKVLSSYHIPVHISSKTGYFETYEIQGIVNLLKVLDNPLQDIPYYGFLKLPFLDFTEEEIASVKAIYSLLHQPAENEKIIIPSLYEQTVFVNTHLSEEEHIKQLANMFSAEILERIQRKTQQTISWLGDFRQRVSYTPTKELIQEILQDTGYAAYVAAMTGGEQRLANMELLLEKAGDFEKTSFYGLFHFVRYLETIREQEVDFGEANILDENADVVRIMTIHKSKGLEFPICFVCGLSKQFNLMDTRQSIVMDVEAGIGVDYIDPTLRIKRKTLRKNVVSQRMKEDTRGEDLRVFYVAMTRAKEKLFLTGYCDDFDDYLKKHARITTYHEQYLSFSEIMDAKNYFDLVVEACMRHRSMKPFLREIGIPTDEIYHLPYEDTPIAVSTWTYQDNLEKELLDAGKSAFLEDALSHIEDFRDEALSAVLKEKLFMNYGHSNLEGLTVKTTVSDLKRAAFTETQEEPQELFAEKRTEYIPNFMKEEETVAGTQYGTAVHKVMELITFQKELCQAMQDNKPEKIRESIQQQMEEWLCDQIVEKEQIGCVSIPKIVQFMQSNLAKKMAQASEKNVLFREQPFVIGLPANRIDGKFPPEETMLIQGVIDVFFYEEDGIILADYKTDRVFAEEELIKRYKTQLDYYEQALEQLTGKKVKQRIIYSFALGKEIPV